VHSARSIEAVHLNWGNISLSADIPHPDRQATELVARWKRDGGACCAAAIGLLGSDAVASPSFANALDLDLASPQSVEVLRLRRSSRTSDLTRLSFRLT
jgi:hypothetical protein